MCGHRPYAGIHDEVEECAEAIRMRAREIAGEQAALLELDASRYGFSVVGPDGLRVDPTTIGPGQFIKGPFIDVPLSDFLNRGSRVA